MPNARASAPPTRTCRRRCPAIGRRSSPALSAGLQAVRNLLPDNTIQSANLKPWTIGVTVTQTLFNGFKTANSVRVAELQVQSGREALRNVGQGVLLDAVTAYTNVLANQSLVEAQRANVAFLRKRSASPRSASMPATSRRPIPRRPKRGSSRGRADLNAAEVNLAISQATYAQVIGNPPGAAAARRNRRPAVCRAAATTPPALAFKRASGRDGRELRCRRRLDHHPRRRKQPAADHHAARQRQPQQAVGSHARHLRRPIRPR